MKVPSLLATATLLAAVGGGLLTAAPAHAAPAGAPTHVRTTVVLTPSLDLRVNVTGRARPGARVALQDRYDEHDNWVTQNSTTVKPHGTFRVSYVVLGQSTGSYRVCVGRACAPGGQKHIVKRTGKITLTSTAPQVVPYETTLIAEGRLSRLLQPHPSLRAQYLNPVSGTWLDIPHAAITLVDKARFRVEADALLFDGVTSKQGQRFRVVAKGNPYVRPATQEWRANSYTRVSLANLPVVAGSRTSGQVLYTFLLGSGIWSAAVSPTDSVTLGIPTGCGRVQFSVSQDYGQSPSGPATAAVSHNGVSVPANGGAAYLWSIDVSGGDTLGLSVDFDHAHPDRRPWFVSPSQPFMYDDKEPFALCSAP